MTIQGLDTILANHPYFKEFTGEYLKLLAGCAANVRYGEGEFLFKEGQEADHFFIIREGTVALELYSPGKGPLILETIGDGGIVGWSWLIPPNQWRADGRASTAVRALKLDGSCLRKKCEADPAFGFRLLRKVSSEMAHSMDHMRMRLLDLYGKADK